MHSQKQLKQVNLIIYLLISCLLLFVDKQNCMFKIKLCVFVNIKLAKNLNLHSFLINFEI